tara:strand:+ start:5150 stop:5995 length:846 start_codon:yes stop_codon:yes gene_type:complete
MSQLIGLSAFIVLVLGYGTLPSAYCQQAVAPSMVPVSHKTLTPHPIDPALKMAYESLQHIRANVDDYHAIFVKRCRVDGVLPDLQYANIKVRNRKVVDGKIAVPLSVYLKYLKPSDVRGREVVWIETKNDGNIIVHETGLKGMINVTLDPNGYLAMRNQRYPITEIGIENLVVKLIETGTRDRQHGECEVQFYQNSKIGETECTMLEVLHPEKRDHFDFYRARVYFDKQLKMPIRYESWSWPTKPGGQPVLEEEYTYLRVTTNTGMTDLDFDISNPAYDFR